MPCLVKTSRVTPRPEHWAHDKISAVTSALRQCIALANLLRTRVINYFLKEISFILHYFPFRRCYTNVTKERLLGSSYEVSLNFGAEVLGNLIRLIYKSFSSRVSLHYILLENWNWNSESEVLLSLQLACTLEISSLAVACIDHLLSPQ